MPVEPVPIVVSEPVEEPVAAPVVSLPAPVDFPSVVVVVPADVPEPPSSSPVHPARTRQSVAMVRMSPPYHR